MGIPVTAYLEGNQWGTWDAQPGTTIQIPIPTKANSSTTWGDWQYPGTVNSRYTHKVPVMGDDLSVLSYNTYYGITLNMYRDGHYTSYPKVSTQVDYTDWGDRTAGGSIPVYVSEFAVAVRVDYSFISQDNWPRENSAYWSEGPTYDLPSQPKTGYSQNNYTSNQGSKPPGSSFSAWGIYSDVTWSTSYSKLVYTATLDKNGGTGGTSGPIYWWNNNWYSNLDTTTQITSITKPTKTGYDFGGYKSGNTLIIDSNGHIVSNISGNVTLVAQWAAHSYTVSFNVNGNITPSSYPESTITPSSVADVQVTYNGTYPTLPTLSRDGFIFDGWVDSNGNPVQSGDTYNPSNPLNHTLFAKWTIKQFTIELTHDNGITRTTIDEITTTTKTVDYYTSVSIGATGGGIAPTGFRSVFQDWRLFTESGYVFKSTLNPYELHVIEDCKYMATSKTEIETYTATIQTGIGTINVRVGQPDYSVDPPLITWDDTSPDEGSAQHSYLYNSEVDAGVAVFRGESKRNLTDPIPWTGETSSYRYTWGQIFNGVTGGWYRVENNTETYISSDNPYLFDIAGNITLKAKCNRYKKYSVTLGATQNGTLKFQNSTSTTLYRLPKDNNNPWAKHDIDEHTDTYKNDYTVTVKSIPNPGKMLIKWVVNGEEIDPDSENRNLKTFNVPAVNTTISAIFDDWTYIWHPHDIDIPCHWNEHYIFIKTDDPITPWKVVKEIKLNTDNGWVTSSSVD